jgi:hypothetical protein
MQVYEKPACTYVFDLGENRSNILILPLKIQLSIIFSLYITYLLKTFEQKKCIN